MDNLETLIPQPTLSPIAQLKQVGRMRQRATGEKAAVMKRGRAAAIIEEVLTAVYRWPKFEAEAQLADSSRDRIQKTHRLSFPEK